MEHVLGGGVSAGNRGEFGVGPVARNAVGFFCGRHHVLCKGPVAFRSQSPAFIRTIVDIRAQHVSHNDPLADSAGVYVFSDRGDLAGDLTIVLPFARRTVGISVVTHREPGEDGYFMLTLTPDRAARATQPRDITVIVDVSGSMGWSNIAGMPGITPRVGSAAMAMASDISP